MSAITHVPAGARRATREGGEPLGVVLPSSLYPAARSVKSETHLANQALANAERATSTAAWHRERAASYLRWWDLPFAAGQYQTHAQEAQYQDALAARHRQIAASMQGVRP